MQFFTSKLWQEMNSDNNLERIRAEEQWERNVQIYSSCFQKCMPYLSKKFVTSYQKHQSFHDCKILSINFDGGRNSKVSIMLSIGDKVAQLNFKSVDRFVVSVLDKSFCIAKELQWGYDEFELLDDGRLKVNILCDVYNEIELIFQNVTVTFL